MSRRFRGAAAAAFLALAFEAPAASEARAAGWKFWQTTESTPKPSTLGTYGGGATTEAPQSSWSMSQALSNSWKTTTNVSKKAWTKTVDIVTLKPLRTSKPQPQPSQFSLGSHPDPRSESRPKPSLFGNLFGSKPDPEARSVEEFMSLPRNR